MAQHDYDVANQAGAGFRSDLNNALAAIVSNNSGATEPATMFAYQFWADTTAGLLKQRNAANNAWITIGTLALANLGLIPASIVDAAGDLIVGSAADTVVRLAKGSALQVLRVNSGATALEWGAPASLRSYLSGFTLSTAGASTTMSISAGQCADSTNVSIMSLGAFSKTTSAWALGSAAGGLDTGAIAASTWYHFFVIQRPDTGVVDALISLSATAPTLPTNYTLFRRIGSGKTNGSSQWTAFTQDGDYFLWSSPVADFSTTNPGTTAINATLLVPTGITVQAHILATVRNTGTGNIVYGYLSDLSQSNTTPSETFSDFCSTKNAASGVLASAARAIVRTNTSAQIRYSVSYSDASVTVTVNTLGWYDTRGKNL